MVNRDSTRKTQILWHVARLPENGPAKQGLQESIRNTKRPRGKPQTTLINTIQKQLKKLNINCFSEAIDLAQDRETWKK